MRYLYFVLFLYISSAACCGAQDETGSVSQIPPKSAASSNKAVKDDEDVLYRDRIGISWDAFRGTFDGVSDAAGKNVEDAFCMFDSVKTHPLQVFILLPLCFILFTAAAVLGYRKLSVTEAEDGGE